MIRQFSNLACLISLLFGSGLMAKVIHVDDNASEGGDGSSWATAHKYLQDGLAVAEYGDEIWVAEGTYKPDQGAGKTAGDRTAYFNLLNGVGMFGGFTGIESSRTPQGDYNNTILSGAINNDDSKWSYHLIAAIDLSESELNGFLIKETTADGNADDSKGGYLFSRDSNLTVAFCSFEFSNNLEPFSNWANNDSQIFSDNSSIVFNSCFIKGTEIDNPYNESHPRPKVGIRSNNSKIYFESTKLCRISIFNEEIVVRGRSYAADKNSFFTFKNSTLDRVFLWQIDYEIPDYSEVLMFENSLIKNSEFILSVPAYFRKSLFQNTKVNSYLDHGYELKFVDCTFSNFSSFSDSFSGSKKGGNIFFSRVNFKQMVYFEFSLSDTEFSNCLIEDNNINPLKVSGSQTQVADSVFMNNSVGAMKIHNNATINNCLFIFNTNSGDGGAIYIENDSDIKIYNSTFYKNSSDITGGAIYSTSDNLFITNCIFQENAALGGGNSHLEKSGFGDFSNLKNCLVGGGYVGSSNINAVADFVNSEDPNGLDDLWFTDDDGLRLKKGSLAIDAGYDHNDSSKYDIAGFIRRQGNSIDIGAYEYGDLRYIMYNLQATSSPSNAGTINGGGTFEDGNETLLLATPNNGYLFSSWSGYTSGSTNPLSITMDSDKSITAYFIQDLNDDDGDGLTNFAELVTHGTDPSKQDTDNDGILDAKEIEIGSDPKSSDSAVFNFGRDEGIAEGKVIGRSEGEQSVIGNPGSFGLVAKESYDLLRSKLEECESTKFPWVEFDDFSNSTLDPEKWELMWWHGAQPPTTSNGMLVLNGNGQLHSPPSKNSPLFQSYIDNKLAEEGLPLDFVPTSSSFAQVKHEGLYGLKAKLMLPSGSARETGMEMVAAMIYEDGSTDSFEFEIGYWSETTEILELEFAYNTSGLGKVSFSREGEFDKFYEVSLIHLDGKNSLYFEEELIFEFNSTWSPNYFHFFAFNDQEKPFNTYVKDVKVLVPGTPNPVPTTPYTPAWFYVPNQGWMWTQKSAYPYFYDADSSNWMYFQSGHENPRFYHYGTKEWMSLE